MADDPAPKPEGGQQPTTTQASSAPGVTAESDAAPALRQPPARLRNLLAIRRPAPLWQVVVFSLLCIVACFGLWWAMTRGAPEERMLSYSVLPSPEETF